MGAREESVQPTADVGAIQALAWGFADAGVSLVTGYPGFHAHELVDLCGGTFSVNERTAFGVAWGASAAGARTAVAIKNVGLNDAADPFLNSIRLETPGGMVVVVFDDVEVAGSQCRQDSRPYFDLAQGLWFEPVDAPHAYWCAREAVVASERFGVPVVVRVTNPLLRSSGAVVRSPAAAGHTGFRRDPERLVTHPVNARPQERAAAVRQSRIAEYVESLYAWPDHVRGELHITAGAAGGGASTGEPDHVAVWTYPLPERRLGRAVSGARSVVVSELGGPFVSRAVRLLTGDTAVRTVDPALGVDHSRGYRTTDAFETLFGALRSFPGRVVCGGLGSYTMDPARPGAVCLCYGAGVAVAAGCALAAREGTVFCVTGDAAFLHSGQSCLGEVAARGARVVVVVVDNGRAASTGGQRLPAELAVSPAIHCVTVRHADTTGEEYHRVLNRLTLAGGVSVLRVMC